MTAMKIKQAGTQLYQNSSITYLNTDDFRWILRTKSYWYGPIFVEVIWKYCRGLVFWTTVYQGGTSYKAGGGRPPPRFRCNGARLNLCPHFPMVSLFMVWLKFGDQRICLLVTVPTDNFRPIWYISRKFCGLVLFTTPVGLCHATEVYTYISQKQKDQVSIAFY